MDSAHFSLARGTTYLVSILIRYSTQRLTLTLNLNVTLTLNLNLNVTLTLTLNLNVTQALNLNVTLTLTHPKPCTRWNLTGAFKCLTFTLRH